MTSPAAKGTRLAHSIASSFDFTWIIQNPAISSFAGNGPSVTVGAPRENLTRAPFELGWIPSPASSTPAFPLSSLPGTVLSAPRPRHLGGPTRTGRTSTVLEEMVKAGV